MENASTEESQKIGHNLRHPGMLASVRSGRREELERKTEAKLRGSDIKRYRVQVLCRDEETCVEKTGMERRHPLILKN
ncbi:hypothetical protein PGB90_010236 [Kerria lacca]